VVDLVLAGGAAVTTTEDHPFWNATDRGWQDAQDLDPGDRLLTPDGRTVTVSGLAWSTARTDTAYNLTVADTPTYYVVAGAASVLVHNCPPGTALRSVGAELGSVNDVMANPELLGGKSPAQVEAVIGRTPGWRVERLGSGEHAGQGWLLREYNDRGNPTGRMIRWHPGGGHHGQDPYWRVTDYQTKSGIIR
jgi:hypothetical protein